MSWMRHIIWNGWRCVWLDELKCIPKPFSRRLDSYDEVMEALKESFEPSSQNTQYQAELLVQHKNKAETWWGLAENLRLLADKGFSDLEDDAQERLALNAYMAKLKQPQVAIGVKQRISDTLDAAVTRL